MIEDKKISDPKLQMQELPMAQSLWKSEEHLLPQEFAQRYPVWFRANHRCLELMPARMGLMHWQISVQKAK